METREEWEAHFLPGYLATLLRDVQAAWPIDLNPREREDRLERWERALREIERLRRAG
jgi:hypothetical protein